MGSEIGSLDSSVFKGVLQKKIVQCRSLPSVNNPESTARTNECAINPSSEFWRENLSSNLVKITHLEQRIQ